MRLRSTQRERCPYCHDALGQTERIECEACGTPHHPACLDELGTCTVLGCGGGVVARARRRRAGPADELRERVRRRAARYARGPDEAESEEALRRRLNGQPTFCPECLKEIRVFSCPECGGPLAETCDGSARHCARAECRAFYDRLGAVVGAPIDAESAKWGRRYVRFMGGYVQKRALYFVVLPGMAYMVAVAVAVLLALLSAL